MIESLIPSRSVEDYVDGRIPVVIGGTRYSLPELPIRETDEWAAVIDERLRGLVTLVENVDESQGLVTLFDQAKDLGPEILASLKAYDKTGALPTADELRDSATHTQILFAFMGVWASTKSPLAVGALQLVELVVRIGDQAIAQASGSAPVSTPPSRKRKAGRSPKSVAN